MTSLSRAAAAALVALIAALAAAPAAASGDTKWLCRPGLEDNPCTGSLKTTRIAPSGEVLATRRVRRDRPRRVDCFYVYPTVSDQPTPVASRRIDPELRSIARFQAARYSQVCRVFAPVYRQITLAGLFAPGGVTPAMRRRAYGDVRTAWRTYLRRHNHGRGVVLVGHSQGTFMLRRLLAEEIDGRRSARRRLVSAILLGGNVLVRRGRDAGGDFDRVRACRSARQLGCVVAFSAFNATPPEGTLFGVPRRLLGVGPEDLRGVEVLCTNPAALRGGRAPLHTLLPSRPFAPGTTIGAATELVGLPDVSVPGAWIEARGTYTGRCSEANGANVLRIAGEPVLNTVSGPAWGLHLADANLALGDLVKLVRRQAARYARTR